MSDPVATNEPADDTALEQEDAEDFAFWVREWDDADDPDARMSGECGS